MKPFRFVCFSFFLPLLGFSQGDTLRPAEVRSNLIFVENPGVSITQFDEKDLIHFEQSDLGVLLEQRSPVTIRRYGPGGLTSASFRGGNANHTLFLWNGLPINSATNGQIDVSLIPTGGFNSIALQFGGESAQWGSGAVGGSVLLNNLPHYGEGLKLSISGMGGSFSNSLLQSRLNYGTDRYSLAVFFGRQRAKNDFPFLNTTIYNAPKQRQPDMAFQQNYLLVNQDFLIKPNQELSLYYWYQENNKNIPPTMSQRDYDAQQADVTHRLSAKWQWQKNGWELAYRNGLFWESLLFTDSTSQLFGDYITSTLIQDAQIAKQWLKNRFQMGVQQNYQQVETNNFDGLNAQNRWALYSGWNGAFLNSALQGSISFRYENIDGAFVPLVYSAGLMYSKSDNLKFRINGGSLYRVPTLNDRFWQPGGNPDLLPELGTTLDGGFTYLITPQSKKFQLEIDLNGFTRRMNNWIIWLPDNALWQAQNLLEVWSRGMESRWHFSYQLGNKNFTTEIKTNYTLSTQEKSNQIHDASIGKQILYVPIYAGQWMIGYHTKAFDFRWISTYTGYRYTATDHSSYLSPFWLHGLQFSYNHKISTRLNAREFLRINNLFGTNYQLVQNRAMPLVNFEIGATLTIQ